MTAVVATTYYSDGDYETPSVCLNDTRADAERLIKDCVTEAKTEWNPDLLVAETHDGLEHPSFWQLVYGLKGCDIHMTWDIVEV